jgi:RNA polymerase sigma-70 factor, ECF subfamily
MTETRTPVERRTGWEEVYRDIGPRLQRALLLYAGNLDVAEDAVAEAFAQGIHRGDAIRDPGAWVWKAAFRIAAGRLKERSRITGRLPEAAYDPPESARDLLVALGQLSPAQRASVVLHDYAGYPASEIASIIGSTAPAVFVHLSRARKRLRTLLEVDDA